VGNNISRCNQPRTIAERLSLANGFVKDFDLKLPMVVDTMANSFQTTYAAWPFRFFVVHNGKLALIAQPHADTHYYQLDDLRAWLGASCGGSQHA